MAAPGERDLFQVIRENLELAKRFARNESAYWRTSLEQKRKTLDQALANPDVWRDFRRNSISGALDNANALRRASLARRMLDWFVLRLLYRRVKGELAPTHWKYLEETPAGAPRIQTIDGVRVSKSSLEFACMFAHLLPRLAACKVVVEIGGGYGGLARIIKDAFPHLRYVILDLPEISAIQTYYLGTSVPGARIAGLRGLGDASPLDGDFDFLLLPPPFIEKLPPESVDLFINTRSMMEMDLETVGYYFAHLQKSLRPGGAFYCLNRYEKLCRFRDYPFDERWGVEFSRPWPRFIDYQPHHELLAVRSAESVTDGARELVRALHG